MTNVNLVNHDYTGERPSYVTKKRTCKLLTCNTVLNKYNINEFCHAHTAAGVDERWQIEEKIRLKAYKKQKKAIEAKATLRRKEKEAMGIIPIDPNRVKRAYRKRKKEHVA